MPNTTGFQWSPISWKYVIFSMWLAEKGSVKFWTSIKSDWKLAARNILFDYLFHFPYPNSPRGTVTMTITRKTPADGRLVQSICLALPMKTSWSLFPHFWRADSWCKQDGLSGKGPPALLQLLHWGGLLQKSRRQEENHSQSTSRCLYNFLRGLYGTESSCL